MVFKSGGDYVMEIVIPKQDMETRSMKNTKLVCSDTYQQGDLLMRRIFEMPQGEPKIVCNGRIVLAHGESGHSHILESDDAELVQIGERMLVRFSTLQTIKHEEHNAPNSLIPEPIYLSPGIWEVGRVQEHDYFSKMARPVQD
jgi:hypothetical protein